MADKHNPRQLSPVETPYLTRDLFVHPNRNQPSILDVAKWRLVAGEPVNRLARKMIQREVSSLNYRIIPKNPENEDHETAALYYTEIFKDFRSLVTRTIKSICELPQGGAWELGWVRPSLFDEGGRGTLSFVKFIDAGTLQPTTSSVFPIIQIDPENTTRRMTFKEEEIHRTLAFPRDEFHLQWWQESPTESSYLAIEALARIYVYYLKQLQDTPVAGILDMMDFKEEAAAKWATSFREMLTGIDPIKIPILYEHDKQAKWIPMGRNPSDLDIPIQFRRFAEMVLSNYGLSVEDLRMFNDGATKAGAAVSRKISTSSGIGFFAELIKDSVQQLLPAYLVFEYSDVDIEQERTKAQIRAADARTLVSIPFLPVRIQLRQLQKRGVLDVDLDPEAIEEEFKEAQQQAQDAALGPPEGATKPGQLETGEGRPRDVLEDDAKANAAGGARLFAKSLPERVKGIVDNAVSVFKASLPEESKANFPASKYGIKKEAAVVKLANVLDVEFRKVGTKLTKSFVAGIMDKAYTQVPDALMRIPKEPMESKAWTSMVDAYMSGEFDYLEKQESGEMRLRIAVLVEELLLDVDLFELSDEEFLEIMVEIFRLAYEDGLLAASELVQAELHKKGERSQPTVELDYNIVDPKVLTFLEEKALESLSHIDGGTRFFLARMLTEGVMQGLSVDVLTDRIQADLFGLPEEEAGKFNRSRIRSIVTTEINRADTYGRLEEMRRIGFTLKRWITRLIDVCPLCIRNENKGSVKLDFLFEDVFGATLGPPGHPVTCHCTIGADIKELDGIGTDVKYWTGGAGKELQATKSYNGREKFNPYHDEIGRFTFSPDHKESGGFDNFKSLTLNERHTLLSKDMALEEISGESEAVQFYIDGGHDPINAELRGESKRGLSQADEEAVGFIDSAIENNEVSVDSITYRGAKTVHYNSKLTSESSTEEQVRVLRDTMVGSVITDKGFVSTTIDINQAELFMNKSATTPSELTGVGLLEIRVPKGSNGLYVHGVSDVLTVSPGELELLLPRDVRFRVLSVDVHNTKLMGEVPLIVLEIVQGTD